MPGKSRYHADEYESDDFEHTDTLIGRNRVSVAHTKKKPRPSSASKSKTPRRPVTPGKKKRAQSAPTAKSGHELWMNAVKNRMTVGLSSNKHPQSPRHKTPSEYWIETLRRTGNGLSTESTGMNTFQGKRPRDKDMPYLSTPSYLRQMVGTERGPRAGDPTAKAAPGTPNYKSQEEYYEQILEYKKQMSSMNQEASTMKAKIRRLEEDNIKKEKEIDVLLNPQKSEELRRTLADKRPDSGSVIHSLKQKILKLETQLRDKETSFIKLQGDLKTTKIDEMKQQLEVFYGEIVRLQNSKDTGMDKSARGMSRDGTIKVKALNETILRLNKSNEQLQNENRSLKEDLKNSIDSHRDGPHRDYEDMNRKELLRTIGQLEKKVEKAERYMDGSSIVSYESKAAPRQGKVALDGNLEDRLDQLDKRESELLAIVEKKNDKIKHLMEERNRWKRRCEELENMLTSGHVEHHEYVTDSKIEKSRQKSPSVSSRPPSSRPLSARRDRPHSARSESDRPPSARDRSGSRVERPLSGKVERGSRPPSARRRSSLDSGVSSVRRQRIKDFKENRSAKVIQKNWRSHNEKKQTRLSEQGNKEKAYIQKPKSPKSPNGHKHSESKTEIKHGQHHAYKPLPHQDSSHKTDKHPLHQDSTALASKTLPHQSGLHKTAEYIHTHASKSLPHKTDSSTPRSSTPRQQESAATAKQASPRLDNEKVQRFRENSAAKKIQKNWTQHQYKKQQHEADEASDLIRSALMGHSVRQQQMQRRFSTDYEDDDEDYETGDEDYKECVNMIQSAMKGHNTRKTRMREYQFSSTGEDDYDDDDDDDIMETPKRRFSSSTTSRSNRPQSGMSGRSRSSFSSSKGSGIRSGTTYNNRAHSSAYDDDDDF